MKLQLLLFLSLFLLGVRQSTAAQVDSVKLTVFEDVVYYDGYAALVPLSVKPGLVRTNTSYTRLMDANEIATLAKGEVRMQVDLKAACDNYDRLAYVSLLLVEKGKAYPQVAKKIEVGRYITPFMDRNKQPNVRPYVWDVTAMGDVLRNPKVSSTYDIYIQMNIFGVPYAAQKQIKGCEGKNDVFVGNLFFTVFPVKDKQKTNYQFHEIAYQDSISNYKSTDTLGKTTKTYRFKVDKNLNELELYIISSNHGANRNGEEYNRRIHYIYLDDQLVFSYLPGESTCEPYRYFNTQSNGIYGKSTKTNEQWQKFSNWCPGAIIPLRKVNLAKLKKGEHQLRISVPDAKFENKEGTIPFSAYIIGR
ncbi:MAG: peptide-N-glycosidase F-related protein [Bacteroidia bacterium]